MLVGEVAARDVGMWRISIGKSGQPSRTRRSGRAVGPMRTTLQEFAVVVYSLFEELSVLLQRRKWLSLRMSCNAKIHWTFVVSVGVPLCNVKQMLLRNSPSLSRSMGSSAICTCARPRHVTRWSSTWRHATQRPSSTRYEAVESLVGPPFAARVSAFVASVWETD